MKSGAQKRDDLVAILEELAPEFDRGRIKNFAKVLIHKAALRRAEEEFLSRRKGKVEARAELRELSKRAFELRDRLDDLGAETAPILGKILREKGAELEHIIDVIEALANAGLEAHCEMEIWPHTRKPPNRPKESAAREIAREAARYFEEMAGEKPGRRKLQKFLGRIFEVLEISASTENQARAALNHARAGVEKRVEHPD